MFITMDEHEGGHLLCPKTGLRANTYGALENRICIIILGEMETMADGLIQ